MKDKKVAIRKVQQLLQKKQSIKLSEMNKGSFSLQSAQFSDSDSQTPMEEIIASYNRQYSLIYQQIKQFLKQCKDNINKYIQLNQFGARFNMYALLGQMGEIETSALTGISDVKKQQLQNQRNIKNHFEKQFHNIIQNMGNVIKDFLKFEVDFKREYFGWNISQNQLIKNQNKTIPSIKNSVTGKLSSSQSIKSGDSKLKRSFVTSEEDSQKQTQLEQKLREILKRKLAPQKQSIIKFCDNESDPYKNMLKLQQKIDMMQSEVILSRNKEQKLIQIFNKKRIENIQGKMQSSIHHQLIEINGGSKHRLNDTKSSQSEKENRKDIYKIGNGEMKAKESSRVDMVPAMSIHNAHDKGNFGIVLPSSSSTPHRVISPRGMMRNALQNDSKLGFFVSPKAMVRVTGIQFKKKRQPQDQQTQSTVKINQANVLLRQQEQGEMIDNQVRQLEDVPILTACKQNLNLNPSKNRDRFLLRRRGNV